MFSKSLSAASVYLQHTFDVCHQFRNPHFLLQNVFHQLFRRQMLEILFRTWVLAVEVVNRPVERIALRLFFFGAFALGAEVGLECGAWLRAGLQAKTATIASKRKGLVA